MACMQLFLIVSILTLTTAQIDTEEPCLMASNGSSSLPPFELPEAPDHLVVDPIQSLITSYQFNCCGYITTWEAFVRPTMSGTMQFQVWRPLGNGCFIIVGSNELEEVSFADTIIEHIENPIQVQPGDIIGYSLSKTDELDPPAGIVFSEQLQEEQEWYSNSIGATQMTLCPRPAAENGTNLNTLHSFNNQGLLITAAVATFDCSPTLSTAIPTQTTAPTMLPATPTPDVTTPPSPIDSATIIGASVGGALGGFLLTSIANMVIVAVIGCRVARKSSIQKTNEQKAPQQEALYDEIQDTIYDEIRENGDYRYKDSPQHIVLSSNLAYSDGISAMNLTFKDGKDEMEDNSAYGEVSMVTKDKEETENDDNEEYIPMAPLTVQTPDKDQYDTLKHEA